MARVTLLAATLLVLTGASSARGRDTDEVKGLKEKVELLQAKLEAANLKIEKLQAENERLRAGGAAARPAPTDGFGVGTKLTGRMVRAFGKQATKGNAVDFEVTKRAGKAFTGEYWCDNQRKGGVRVEGTIESGVVKFTTTKALGDYPADLIGLHTFTGRFDDGVLKGTMSKKGDAAYKATWEVRVAKE